MLRRLLEEHHLAPVVLSQQLVVEARLHRPVVLGQQLVECQVEDRRLVPVQRLRVASSLLPSS